MARIRTVKPEFWADEKIGGIGCEARLLFLCSLNFADDEGLIRWTPEYMKSIAFMYDDDIPAGRVSELMEELRAVGLVYTYMVGKTRQRLAYIVNFRKHQNINRPQPSKLLPPSVQDRFVAQMYLERDGYTCHLCKGPVPRVRQLKSLDPYSSRNPEPVDMTCVNPSLDHVVARARGGADHPSNIRIAHLGCNMGRRDRDIESFSQPTSVGQALAFIEEHRPEQLQEALTDSVTDSLNGAVTDSHTDALVDSLTEGQPAVAAMLPLDTVRHIRSVNDSQTSSVSHSPPEGKGTGKGRREATPNGVGAAAPPSDINAGSIVGAWVEAMNAKGVKPTNGMRGQVGRLARELLDGGNDPARVLEAAKVAGGKGFATIDRELGALAGRSTSQRPAPVDDEEFQLPTPPREIADDPDRFVLWAREQKAAWLANRSAS